MTHVQDVRLYYFPLILAYFLLQNTIQPSEIIQNSLFQLPAERPLSVLSVSNEGQDKYKKTCREGKAPR